MLCLLDLALLRPLAPRGSSFAQMCTIDDLPEMKRLRRLEADLAAAVADERYDAAASFRDELANLRYA